MPPRMLSLRGAAEHNLQDLDVDLPHEKLLAITGVSGSGKTSLAFDTLYAEARRRFLLALGATGLARQVRAPRLRRLEGVAPAVAIDQGRARQNPRSTVAIIGGLHEYLRLLFARLGQARCLRCGAPVHSQRLEEAYETGAGLPAGTQLTVLAPRRLQEGEEVAAFVEAIDRTGYQRLRVGGRILSIEEVEPAVLEPSGRAEVVVDRLTVKPETLRRLHGSLEAALEVGEGQVVLLWEGGEQRFSVRPSCSACATPFRPLSPALFSFNSAQGACPSCRGLGLGRHLDSERLFADQASLEEALGPLWTGELPQILSAFCSRQGLDPDTPVRQWPPQARDQLWQGQGRFKGLRRILEAELKCLQPQATGEAQTWFEERLGEAPCPACGGTRLVREALAVEFEGHTIASLCAHSIEQAAGIFARLGFAGPRAVVGQALAAQIRGRLETLAELGLGYLQLDRRADTLSSGEFQRLRLGTALGARMSQVLYVLDEPSVGLHARDAERLLRVLRSLRDAGNTVLVVEHDLALIRGADHVVDLGPGAGVDGGRIAAQGTPAEVMAADSLTGRYLSGRRRLAGGARRSIAPEGWLEIQGASGHNLKTVTAAFPLGNLVCVTGVSGSGKSTLVHETLYPLLALHLGQSQRRPLPCEACRGLEQVERVVEVDQHPIGRTPRSNPATYTGLLRDMRLLYAELPDSRLRGYRPSHFSFNAPEGACPECRGSGRSAFGPDLFADLEILCANCGGRRFRGEVLEVRYRGRSIADALDLSIEEGLELFGAIPEIARRLRMLAEVGLGYLRLGQPAPSLSGGEAQRVKLATELSRPQGRRTLYLLDEPTTGLHLEDVRFLLELLQRLVDQGNSVIVVEHHLELIAAADYVIDLGPEGGEAGGEVVAVGPPREIARVERSWTGRFLKELLARSAGH